MPNWCDNEITITGDKDLIDQIYNVIENTEGEKGLLNLFRPEPDYTVTPVKRTYPEITAKYSDTEEGRKEALENKPSIRPDSWWDWRVQNWGTKWELNSVHAEKERYSDKYDTIKMYFRSAWSPPIAALEYWRNENPDKILHVELAYSESGCDFCGLYENGVDHSFTMSELTVDFLTKDPVGKRLEEIFDFIDQWDAWAPWKTKPFIKKIKDKIKQVEYPDADLLYELESLIMENSVDVDSIDEIEFVFKSTFFDRKVFTEDGEKFVKREDKRAVGVMLNGSKIDLSQEYHAN